MKVLLLTPDYPPDLYGGIGTHVYELQKRLCDLGCQVTILVTRFFRNHREDNEFIVEKEGNLTVVRFPTELDINDNLIDTNFKNSPISTPFKWGNMSIKLLPDLINYLKSCDRFDIFHVHDSYQAYVSVAIKDLFNLPMVSTVHSVTAPTEHLMDSLKRYLLNNSYAGIAVSNWIRDEIIDRYGAGLPIIEVIHNGVSKNLFTTNLQQVKEDKIITFCGRLSTTKGCDLLIRAFAKILNDMPEFIVKLYIAGDGPMAKRLRELCYELGVEEHVNFLGFLEPPMIRNLLKKSYIHVVPSTQEPFGIVALEAIAEEVPVIVSDVGGLKEIIDGKNGLKFNPNNLDELVIHIKSLLTDISLRDELIKNSQKTLDLFSWNKLAQKTLDVYRFAILKHCENKEEKVNF
ncbi:glycosyltransferase family 4 protein [Metabacillus halosaccharovorans]|uniref:glycosyltransferase n=1 Tax=Metabacillus halosaccharovorans TaxID=930124 RepID=UPI00403DB2D7